MGVRFDKIIANKNPGNCGIKRLVRYYKELFRIPENVNHYSDDAYRAAEKKFVKFALREGLSSY